MNNGFTRYQPLLIIHTFCFIFLDILFITLGGNLEVTANSTYSVHDMGY